MASNVNNNNNLPYAYQSGICSIFYSNPDPDYYDEDEDDDPEVVATYRRERMLTYASAYQLDTTELTDQQIMDDIFIRTPCQWISDYIEWLERNKKTHGKYLDLYTTDLLMEAIGNEFYNKLTPKNIDLLSKIGYSLYQGPRVTQKFMVHRGHHGTSDSIKQGQVLTFSTLKSGTFSIDTITKAYLNFNTKPPCCMIQIFVPVNSLVGYQSSEDQIIFPAGAEFFFISGPSRRNVLAHGEQLELTSYQCIYINAPQAHKVTASTPNRTLIGSTQSLDNIYSLLPLYDAYLLCYSCDLPFPYGDDPYLLLSLNDHNVSNHEFIHKILAGRIDLNNPFEMRVYLALNRALVSDIGDSTPKQLQRLVREYGYVG